MRLLVHDATSRPANDVRQVHRIAGGRGGVQGEGLDPG